MESNKNEIDELLRDKLGDYKIPFDESYWKEAQKGIPTKSVNNGKRGIIAIGSGIVLLLASVSAYFLMNDNALQSDNEIAKHTTSPSTETNVTSSNPKHDLTQNTNESSNNAIKIENPNNNITTNQSTQTVDNSIDNIEEDITIKLNPQSATNNTTVDGKLNPNALSTHQKAITEITDSPTPIPATFNTTTTRENTGNKSNNQQSKADDKGGVLQNTHPDLPVDRAINSEIAKEENHSTTDMGNLERATTNEADSDHTASKKIVQGSPSSSTPLTEIDLGLHKNATSTPLLNDENLNLDFKSSLYLTPKSFRFDELNAPSIVLDQNHKIIPLVNNPGEDGPKIKREKFTFFLSGGYNTGIFKSSETGVKTTSANDFSLEFAAELPIKKSRFGFAPGINISWYKESLEFDLLSIESISQPHTIGKWETASYSYLTFDTVFVQGVAFLNPTYVTDSLYNPAADSFTQTKPVEKEENVKATNRITYVEVPLMLSYYVNIKKLDLFVMAGPVIGTQIKASGVIRDPNDNTKTYRYSNGNNINDLSLSFQSRVKVGYSINENWGVFAEPSFRLGLNSITNSSTGQDRKYSSFGGRLGVMFRL